MDGLMIHQPTSLVEWTVNPRVDSSIPFYKVCHACLHILDEILLQLSASEGAYVLALVNLPEGQDLTALSKKYIKLIRDIPEHERWISTMISRGHTVLHIGSDIPHLMMRLEDPFGHWESFGGKEFKDEKPLRLWLAVRVSREAHQKRQQRLEDFRSASYSVLKDGTTTQGRGIKNLRKMDMILTDSNVISPPDSMNVPEHELWLPQWTRSSTPNMSHIQIVWAQFPRFCGTEHDITPRVHLCPLQNNARDPGDIMGGRHRSVIGYNCCSEIAPGTQAALFGARKEKVEATMPYICLNTGLQSTSQEVTGGEERLRADDWAFIIPFRCMGEATGPQIRPELHGIPWPSD